MWDMNWIAVVGAAIAGFAIGGIWYGPLFLKVWQREAGVTQEQMEKRHPAIVFGGAFILNLIAAFILGHVLATYGNPALDVSIMIASGVALGFIVTAIGVNYLFAAKSLKLFAIDAGYWLVMYTVMGAIFGAFR
jgi:Protein of unknown function (DUF1761)